MARRDEFVPNTDALIQNSASPGFTWARSGAVPANTWLLKDSIPSNVSGKICPLLNANIVKIDVANQDATSGIIIEVYTHDGDSVNLTLIGSVTTAATRSNTFTVSLAVAQSKQIALKLSASSAAGKNIEAGCLIKGDLA